MDDTSGIAGPRWGGKYSSTGRISFVSGAIDISNLEIENNYLVRI